MRPVGHQWGLPCWCVSRRARGIQHVFVLILESRSGAHVLGLSSIAGIDAASGFGTEFYGTTERDAHANNLFLFVVPRLPPGSVHAGRETWNKRPVQHDHDAPPTRLVT